LCAGKFSFPNIEVNSSNTNPLYEQLKGAKDKDIGWNFTKLLVKRGRVFCRFEPPIKPTDLERALPKAVTVP
jgi:glutathione peroxidase-family protein